MLQRLAFPIVAAHRVVLRFVGMSSYLRRSAVVSKSSVLHAMIA
jgi:hypothetical protein